MPTAVQLLGWQPLSAFPGSNVSASDCWGYTAPSGREYAQIALSNGTGFVEVTDPGTPVVVDFESGPSSLWRGLKTYSTYAYAVSEGCGGIQVFDLSSIDSGVVTLANTVLTGGFSTATHTLAVDDVSGFLYRAGGSSQGIVIYSLANPAAPNPVGQWHTQYVHEVLVATWDLAGPYLGKEIAFCFVGYSGAVKILDVTSKAAITEIATLPYTGAVYAQRLLLRLKTAARLGVRADHRQRPLIGLDRHDLEALHWRWRLRLWKCRRSRHRDQHAKTTATDAVCEHVE